MSSNHNFYLGPPITSIDDLTAVPRDIEELNVNVVFDILNHKADVESRVHLSWVTNPEILSLIYDKK